MTECFMKIAIFGATGNTGIAVTELALKNVLVRARNRFELLIHSFTTLTIFKGFAVTFNFLDMFSLIRLRSQGISKSNLVQQCLSTPRCNNASTATQDEVKLQYLQDKHAGIAVIGMNRPAAKNSLGKDFVKIFRHHLNTLQFEKDIRVCLLRSLIPGMFCAGADLKERGGMPQDEVAYFVSQLQKMMNEIYNLPCPTIAALDGYALGGGLEMALACDMRVAAKNVKMGLVEAKLAIIPGAGGTQHLPRIISPPLAKELIFTGRIIDGEEAGKIDLVNHVVEQNSDGDAAYIKGLAIAEEIVNNGPIALRVAKLAINRGVDVDITTGQVIEALCYAQVLPTKDRIEGLNAFKEKRTPQYRFDVTIFVRNEKTIPEELKGKVSVILGDVVNEDDVKRAVEGKDGVIVTLGTRVDLGPTTVLSKGTSNIINAMQECGVKRISVCISAFLFYEPSKIPEVYHEITADHKRQAEILESCDLGWTAVCPPHILNDAGKGVYKVCVGSSPGRQISKYDLADLLLKCIQSNEYVNQKIGLGYEN
uniref:NAD(P)-binding domain-containing protein n=1 Tax=Strigamia maritima TaxID=126957 RepID=T1IIG1_STRMM